MTCDCGQTVQTGAGAGFVSQGLRYVRCDKCGRQHTVPANQSTASKRKGPAYNVVNYDRHCPSLVPILDEAHSGRG